MIEFLTVFNRALSLIVVLLPAAIWRGMIARKLFRGNTFFGARAQLGFAESGAGRAIRKRFDSQIMGGTLVAAIASLLLPIAIASFVGVMIASLAGTVAFAVAHSRARRDAAPTDPPAVRVASLVGSDDGASFWLDALDWLAMLAPLAAPAATLIFLATHGQPVKINHQGPSARLSVAFGLILGLMCSANQWALRYRARSGDWAPTAAASRKYRTYLGAMPAFIFAFIIAQLCVLSLMPFRATVPWLSHLTMPNYFLVTFPAQAIWLFSMWKMRKWLADHLATESVDPMPDACWKWGSVYFNPNDPAIVVPLRTGVGHSFNCARASVWWVGGTVMALTIASLAQSIGVLIGSAG